METIDTRVMRGIRVYLERRGFEILEEGWAHGGDVVDFIARDEEDLVFVSCQVVQDRTALEQLAIACLAERLEFEDILVRFDVVSMLTVGESRALLRQHLNALGTL